MRTYMYAYVRALVYVEVHPMRGKITHAFLRIRDND